MEMMMNDDAENANADGDADGRHAAADARGTGTVTAHVYQSEYQLWRRGLQNEICDLVALSKNCEV